MEGSLKMPVTAQLPETAEVPVMAQLPERAEMSVTAQLPEMAELPVTAQLPEVAEMPLMAQLPEMAELPLMAQLPEMGDLPLMAQLPEMGELAEMGDLPDMVELPDMAELLEMGEFPEMVELPELPELPEFPELPELPELPEMPEIVELPETAPTPQMSQLPETAPMPKTTSSGGDDERVDDVPMAAENAQADFSSENSRSQDSPHFSGRAQTFDSGVKEMKRKLAQMEEGVDNYSVFYMNDDWDVDTLTPKVKSFGATLPPASTLSRKMADSMIKYAREHNVVNEPEVTCVDCEQFPLLPVTGICGHTRCTQCIKDNGACPCGEPARENLHVNTLIQDLGNRMLQNIVRPCVVPGSKKRSQVNTDSSPQPGCSRNMPWQLRSRHDRSSITRPVAGTSASTSASALANTSSTASASASASSSAGTSAGASASADCNDSFRPIPMTIEMRYNSARELVSSGQYVDAVPLLAHVAVSTESYASEAHALLNQVMAAIIKHQNRPRLTRQLFQQIQKYSTSTWLNIRDLECSLCCSPFRKPVTTPCGHNYCHICLERSLDYWKICPLCKGSLADFKIFMAKETTAITAIQRSINAVPAPVVLKHDEIRLLVCTLAYPGVACPLYVLEPRCWLMVRRVLETGRKFGMLSYNKSEGTTSSIGTILEIRDCINLECGRSIITTVGISRFRVLDKDQKEGCDIARYEPLVDVYDLCDAETWLRHEIALEVSSKAWKWVKSLDISVLEQIENTFGRQPDFFDQSVDTWKTDDGPIWMWWLICILPLRAGIKGMLLTSMDLLKRLLTVSCTLDAINREPLLNNRYISMADIISREELEWLNSRPNAYGNRLM